MEDVTGSLLPCAEKMVFDTKEAAEAAAVSLEWQRGNKLRVYQCRHCNLWHLSTA